MPKFDYDEIVRRIRKDAAGFVATCDADYAERVATVAQRLCDNHRQSPIVLLSGPSGSGKTTSAKFLQDELQKKGVGVHVVSMDDYYQTVDSQRHPRDEYGNFDFESPECLDLTLLGTHLKDLADGREILMPKFDFPSQSRDANGAKVLRLGVDEMAIFEGIHALNPMISGQIGQKASKLYVSCRSDVYREGNIFFKGTWTRLIRRMIRDHNFRGADVTFTMALWAGVRRGEKRYISPYKDLADYTINSFFPYELCALRDIALPLLAHVPEDCQRREELLQMTPRLKVFPALPESMVAPGALIREFIGGGTIQY